MPDAIAFKYGDSTCRIQVPDHAVPLRIKEPVRQIDMDRIQSQWALDLPGPFSKSAKISIVVADKTRLCEYHSFLPALVQVLEQNGAVPSNIQFFVAYGTHARQSDTECRAAYGNIYDTYRFVHHDCTDRNLFSRIGTSPKGTPVLIRKDLLKSNLIITFGALSHHYFAGYGGGRKLLFPGLGYKSDIYLNHSLFLDRAEKNLSRGCMPGNMKNNPLASDLREIDTFNPVPRISIHAILNSRGQVCELITGKNYSDFLNACKKLDTCYRADTQTQFETVIASCGGFPKDINLIQSHKAINNAALFVKDGGSLIILAQCRDGEGSHTFIPYFKTPGFKDAFAMLEKTYKGNGGTALSMMAKTARINIFLKTDLDDIICRTIGVTKIDKDSIETMLNTDSQDTAYIENASLLIR